MVTFEIAEATLRLEFEIPSATGGNKRSQQRLFMRVHVDGRGPYGYGEEAPHPVHGPRVETLVEQLRAPGVLETPGKRSPIADLALCDLLARRAGVPLWRHLGLPKPPTFLRTVRTIGGADLPVLVAMLQNAGDTPPKLKITRQTPWQSVMEAARDLGMKLALDPNGCWSREEASENCYRLEEFGANLLWIEQPSLNPSPWKKRAFDVLADDVVTGDFKDWESYDGIVVKPASIGLANAIRLCRKAAERKRRVVLGCHLQSSILTAASLHLGGFCAEPLADLDSALLVSGDPFTGVFITDANRLHLPTAPGLGVEPAADLDWQQLASIPMEPGALEKAVVASSALRRTGATPKVP